MRKFILLTTALGFAALLAACQTPTAKHGTYDDINAALNQAVAKPATPDAAAAALLPPLAITAPPAKPQLEERFSVSFNNVPAPQFFNAIVSGTRYNMLVHPEVGGTISANLKNVTLFEALDAIRDLYGYDYTVEGNRITIKPLTMQTRVFQVNYLTGSRKGTSDTRVTSNSALTLANNNNNGSPGGTGNTSQMSGSNNNAGLLNNQNSGNNSGLPGSSFIDSAKVSTAYTADFWADLKTALEAIVGKQDGRSVVISPQSGVVVVRAMPDELRNVAAYLRASQLSVDRQVILEAKILEVQLNSNYQTGINWASLATYRGGVTQTSAGFGQPGSILTNQPGASLASTVGNAALQTLTGTSFLPATTNPGSIFGLALQTSNFAALISFLESQGSVHVLSNPRIATLNNQKAVLKVGSDDFFVTGVTTTTTTSAVSNNTSPTVTLEPFFSGVVLDVTPQIDAEGNIILHVHPSVTKVTSVTQTINLGQAGTLVLPLASSSTQETDSIVRGLDGHIVAIGGLMRQTTTAGKSDVPGASDVPLLGALFRNTDQTTAKSELVILIKPTIVKDSASWEQNILDSERHVQELDPRNVRPLY
ncbi:MAG TPA: pilus (MSHA type) biogenesis protein MshL [Burkholderiaceae bacterium]